jgi:hypothetical protein
MIHLPPYLGRHDEVAVTPWSSQSGLGAAGNAAAFGAAASATWPAANIGIFVPFVVNEPTTFTKLFWVNGTAAGDNWDVGLFDEAGTLLVSAGTTVGVGNSTLQAVDVTDTTLDRGRWYMGICHSTTTANRGFGVVPAAGILQGLGCLQDAACAPPLATNANPATYAVMAQAFLPFFGAQGYRTVGP